MYKKKNFRSKSYNYGRRNPIGGGYVIIPSDVERDKYIEHCYRTGTIFILTEENEYIKNVKIDKSSLREIDFPATDKDLGSFVIWADYVKHNYPIVIGVYSKGDEPSELSESEFSFSKSFNKSKVEISGNAKERYLLINSFSEEGSEIIIQAVDPNSKSKLRVIIKGEIKLESSKNVSIKTVENIEILLDKKKLILNSKNGLSYEDDNSNKFIVNENGVSFITEHFNIGEEGQPIPLGEELKKNIEAEKNALTSLFNAIKTAPVTPGDGGATFKAALLTAIESILRGDYSKILSDLSKTA